MVHVNKAQLTTAFRIHQIFANSGDSISHKLLLFYCAECAIKAYYLKKNYLTDTSKIDEGLFKKGKGHALDHWAKELNIPHLSFNTDYEEYKIRELHEFFRYGIEIPESIVQNRIEYLKRLIEEIKPLI